MMASIVKELLHDYAKNKLDIDTRVCIAYAIEQLYKSKAFNKNEIMFLEYYLRGFSAKEIALQYFTTTEHVIDTLSRLLIAIEFASGNLDELFLRKVAAKYSPRQLSRLKEFLTQHSKEFTYENI